MNGVFVCELMIQLLSLQDMWITYPTQRHIQKTCFGVDSEIYTRLEEWHDSCHQVKTYALGIRTYRYVQRLWNSTNQCHDWHPKQSIVCSGVSVLSKVLPIPWPGVITLLGPVSVVDWGLGAIILHNTISIIFPMAAWTLGRVWRMGFQIVQMKSLMETSAKKQFHESRHVSAGLMESRVDLLKKENVMSKVSRFVSSSLFVNAAQQRWWVRK